MRIIYDPDADAVYMRLTDEDFAGPTTTLKADTPPGGNAWIAIDWKDNRIIGIEVLDASRHLAHDFLDQAEKVS